MTIYWTVGPLRAGEFGPRLILHAFFYFYRAMRSSRKWTSRHDSSKMQSINKFGGKCGGSRFNMGPNYTRDS